MSDQLKASAPIPAWQTTLKPGDVVLFRFPFAEPGKTEVPASRACLVLDVEAGDDVRFATIGYGTSADQEVNFGDEIHVMDAVALAAAGLCRPTRFNCSSRIMVSTNHPGWDAAPGKSTPVIGHLDPCAMEDLQHIRARIRAVHHAAMGRRRARPVADFIVAHRRKAFRKGPRA